jgi:hypothetical protein
MSHQHLAQNIHFLYQSHEGGYCPYVGTLHPLSPCLLVLPQARLDDQQISLGLSDYQFRAGGTRQSWDTIVTSLPLPLRGTLFCQGYPTHHTQSFRLSSFLFFFLQYWGLNSGPIP